MKRIDEIMDNLGFKKDAEDSVKAAFIKNLVKQAYGVDVQLPARYQARQETLSFSFDSEMPLSQALDKLERVKNAEAQDSVLLTKNQNELSTHPKPGGVAPAQDIFVTAKNAEGDATDGVCVATNTKLRDVQLAFDLEKASNKAG